MKMRLTRVLFWILVLHVFVSAAFIVNPSFFRGSRLSVFYRVHVMPGPFFNDSQIIDNYSIVLSWKKDGLWTPPVNFARQHVDQYQAGFNPSELYRSRIIRPLFPPSTAPDTTMVTKSSTQFRLVQQILFDQYVPREADSVRLWVINKKVKDFMVETDSVRVTLSR